MVIGKEFRYAPRRVVVWPGDCALCVQSVLGQATYVDN